MIMNLDDIDPALAEMHERWTQQLEMPGEAFLTVSAVNHALQQQDAAECRMLLEELRPQFCHVKGHEFATFLDHAIAAGERASEFIALLLEYGVPAQCVYDWIGDAYQHTPVITATRLGRRDLIEQLVSAGADLHWTSPTGANALSEIQPLRAHQAPREDNAELAALRQWLMDHGLRIDPACSDSQRKMHWASGQPPSWPDVPDLLASGISLEATGWGDFEYDIAMGRAKASDVTRLSDEQLYDRDSWKRTPFLLAITAGDRELAQALLERGSDPHAKGHCGATALHIAARHNHPSLIPWLLELGIPLSVTNDFEETPLHDVVSHSSYEATVVLLENGADVHALTHTQDAVIHVLCDYCDLRLLRLLMDHGANINQISGSGEWPLKDACHGGHIDAVNFLLENGADPNLTSTGDTALFTAVIADSVPCIQRLIDAGADVNATDCDGWTCLYHLRSMAAAKLLLDHGASPAIPDQIGEIPEDWHSIPREVRQMLKEARLAP